MTSFSADRFAAALRGFGPLGIVAVLLVLFSPNGFVGGVLVLAWAQLSRTPWRELGYARPKSWIATVAIGIAFGVAFKLVMKAIVMPLLGADPVNHAYHYVAGNPAALAAMALVVTFSAGFGEETVYRGFLFERLGKLFGSGTAAKGLIVVLTAAWFALMHYGGQGIPGVEQAVVTGLVFGSIFAVTGRIWMLMIAHATFDLTALALIYWNLETNVAHSIFR
ncbi:MAG TPA: type II CAAX endopeptidase family protein [Candidatus Rubrimentiphilum sp.]|nr:type II CAAX endopeptidase family protein [Candidatus Rubrimentiphilum sp.]